MTAPAAPSPDSSFSAIDLKWQVGWHCKANHSPEKFVSAQVPGAVQLDWARAENWPPHWKGNEFERFTWMEDVWWTYRTTLPERAVDSDQTAILSFEGVDYEWSVYLNGDQCLHQQEGMYRSARIELPAYAFSGAAVLTVRIKPAPKTPNAPIGRDQANTSCKPAVSYGWDFHPRLIPLGIWRPVKLEILPKKHLIDAVPHYQLSEGLDRATLELEVSASEATKGTHALWQVFDPSGQLVAESRFVVGKQIQQIVIEHPTLWWPNGYGDAALYTSKCRLDADPGVWIEHRVGFRKLRLIPHPETWTFPDRFPKGPSNPPITLELNNEAIFAKGTNLVGPDIFPGTVTPNRWETLLDHAHAANFNLIRLWGGAATPDNSFFDLCDAHGLLVWVEFPLACNLYPDDPAYLEVLDSESRALIRRLRHRASLALWCGGNELFNAWSRMTPQSHPLRLLDRNCFELDRHRPFLPTSPIMGMGHGHYTFNDLRFGLEAWKIFQDADCTAYTEFGIPAASPEKVLRSFLPPEELFPPKEGTVWESHHAFNVLMPESHLLLNVIEHYFGPSDNLTTLVERSQWLQAEGLRGLYEEARRQKPTAAMALNWCFNEPWPCAANNSLMAWPDEPKPALKTVGLACRPTLASARIEKFQWSAGELFTCEIWLLNDALQVIAPGTITVTVQLGEMRRTLLTWHHEGTAPMENLQGPRVQWTLPEWATETLELNLECPEMEAFNSSYKLSYKPPTATDTATALPRDSEGPRGLNV